MLVLRPLDTDKQIGTSIADYWRRMGVATDLVIIPPARTSDTEYRAKFPAFDMGGNFGVGNNLRSVTKAEVRTPENKYQGQNRGGYVNDALDELVHRYYVTIPFSERQVIAGQIQEHITDQIVTMFLYYNTNPAFIAKRLANIALPYYGNAQLWDVL